jgi:hypothetical protein
MHRASHRPQHLAHAPHNLAPLRAFGFVLLVLYFWTVLQAL